MDDTIRTRLIDVAAGREPADLLIRNARVVDVFNGGIVHSSVSVVAGHFAGFSDGEAREVVDAHGRYLLPGLIDGHVHVESSMLSPERFADMVIPHGTTTIIADPHELANVAGRDALDYILRAAENLPLDMRVMLPSCVPATPFEDAGASLTASDLAPYINHPRVSGLAELMNFPGLVGKDEEILAKMSLADACGKMIDGHAPGLSGAPLDAYAASGVRSDHECVSIEELRDRLLRGMYVHLRQGSAARNLASLLPGVTLAGLRRCLFCTDDAHPETLISEGHMDRHLRQAVVSGLEPVLAVIMATLNAAECYGLNKGAIAPGREADCILVNDLKDFAVHQVYIKGRLVAERGRMVRETPLVSAQALMQPLRIAPLAEDAFSLRLPSGHARVIGVQAGSLLTRDLERTVQTDVRGVFDPERNPGLNLLAVIERHHATGKLGLGLVEGYNLTGGAIASTIAHDSHNLIVVGDNADDMRLAVRALSECGGGIALCRRGEIVEVLPLPIGGLMSPHTAQEVEAVLRRIQRCAHEELGVPAAIDPVMLLSFLALPVIPDLRLTARGLFDVQAFAFVHDAVVPHTETLEPHAVGVAISGTMLADDDSAAEDSADEEAVEDAIVEDDFAAEDSAAEDSAEAVIVIVREEFSDEEIMKEKITREELFQNVITQDMIVEDSTTDSQVTFLQSENIVLSPNAESANSEFANSEPANTESPNAESSSSHFSPREPERLS